MKSCKTFEPLGLQVCISFNTLGLQSPQNVSDKGVGG